MNGLIWEFGNVLYAVSSALGHLWTRPDTALQDIRELKLGRLYEAALQEQHPELPMGVAVPTIKVDYGDRLSWVWSTGGFRWTFRAVLHLPHEVRVAAFFNRPGDAENSGFRVDLSRSGDLRTELERGDLLPRHRPQLLGFAEDLERAMGWMDDPGLIVPALVRMIRQVAEELPEPEPEPEPEEDEVY